MALSPRTASYAALAAVALAVVALLAAARRALDVLPGVVDEGALGLLTNLAHVARLELITLDGEGEPACDAPLAALGRRWERAMPGLVVSGPRAAPVAGSAARIVAGELGQPEVARLLAAARLPLRVDEQGTPFVGERRFEPATFALACTFADPEREGLPLTIVAGAARSRARALEVLETECRTRCVVWAAGERALELELGPRGGARLQSAVDCAAGSSQPWAAADSTQLAAVLDARLLDALAVAERELGQSFTPERLPELVGLHSIERLLRSSGGADVGASFDRYHGRLVALVGKEHEHDLVAVLVAGRLAEELGAPADAWLAEALGVACADGTAGDTLAAWAALLCRGDAGPFAADAELSEAPSDGDASRQSGALEQRVRRALGARALLGALDAAALTRAWRRGLATLEAPERQALEAEYARLVEALPAPDAAPVRDALPARFAGVALTAPARPDLAGHGTRAALDALDRLDELGARVALVTVHVVVPRTGEVVRSLEGDAALVATLAELRARGIACVLAVQPLTGEHGVGPCDHPKLGSPELWRHAVERQAAAVRHAACLARWGGADALCIARGASQFFSVGWSEARPEPDSYAAVRREKERGWQLAVDAGRIAGVPLVALAPQAGLEGGIPVRAALAWIGVDVVPRLVGDAALAPGPDAPLADIVGAQLAPATDAAVIGFAAASSSAFGADRAGGRADRELQRAYLTALVAAAEAPSAPPRLFLRSWSLDGRSPERSEDVAQRPEVHDALRRWFGRAGAR